MTKRLIIRSNDNEDWNGEWIKGEVEHDMRDVMDSKKFDENEWIYWVLGHVFDCRDFDALIEKFVAECDSMKTLTLNMIDGDVTIEKR